MRHSASATLRDLKITRTLQRNRDSFIYQSLLSLLSEMQIEIVSTLFYLNVVYGCPSGKNSEESVFQQKMELFLLKL